MIDDVIVAYANRAFGDNPRAIAYYLRELADPGAFDRNFKRLFAGALKRQPERLNPAEKRILARGLRRLHQRSSTESGGGLRRSARDLDPSNRSRSANAASA